MMQAKAVAICSTSFDRLQHLKSHVSWPRSQAMQASCFSSSSCCCCCSFFLGSFVSKILGASAIATNSSASSRMLNAKASKFLFLANEFQWMKICIQFSYLVTDKMNHKTLDELFCLNATAIEKEHEFWIGNKGKWMGLICSLHEQNVKHSKSI